MAQFKFDVSSAWESALNKLETGYDDICEDMLEAGGKIVRDRLKAANLTFAPYVRLKKPRKNQYGWFSYATFAGKTSDGNRANTAAFINEYGRQGYHPQPARPFIRSTVQASEGDVVKAMEGALEEALSKL